MPLTAFVAVFFSYKYFSQRRVDSNPVQKTSNTSTANPNLKSKQVTSWEGLDVYPAFSPDGNSIVYSSDRNGSFEIYNQLKCHLKPYALIGQQAAVLYCSAKFRHRLHSLYGMQVVV